MQEIYAGIKALIFQCRIQKRIPPIRAIELPCQINEKQYNGFYPAHLEQIGAHVAHGCKEITKKPYDLAVNPVEYLFQHGVGHKVSYEHGSPPSKK